MDSGVFVTIVGAEPGVLRILRVHIMNIEGEANVRRHSGEF
jgi:hypothetical protein